MTVIFELDCSVEPDRPFIDFELSQNSRQDWAMVNTVIDEQMPVEKALPIEITLGSRTALEWDWYMLPGTMGLISLRARDLLKPFSNNHFDFVELALNQ